MNRSTLLTQIRRLVCRHDWQPIQTVVEGATLSWAGTMTRQFGYVLECPHCGQRQYRGGLVSPYDKRLHPESYDHDGWPIDEHGQRLEPADGRVARRRPKKAALYGPLPSSLATQTETLA